MTKAMWSAVIGVLLGLATMAGGAARAQGAAALAVVHPVTDCATLANAPLAAAVGAPVTARAKLVDTPKGQFCQVTGTIAPTIGFEVDLPVAKWTQRFLQAGCGGLCGSINASIGNAGKCRPALDGEFVVAASDLGHQGGMSSPDQGGFTSDPQKRIDFAYRANHVTALAAKALIRAYYGRPQRYAYFSGCSDGGREALMEAERYPDDFDGISAGAPVMAFQTQNSFWQMWAQAANLRPDGSPILFAERLPILHAAVIAHCDTLDGTEDGLLTDPRVCKVDPEWVRCPAGAADTSNCLTADEWGVAARLYSGPVDAAGHRFLPGGAQPGSELQWMSIPRRDAPPGGDMMARMVLAMPKVVYAEPTSTDGTALGYPFTTAQFQRANALHGLNDSTNPDLSRFAAHGGRLVMWHGWSDTSVLPMISVAYHQAVRRQLGADAADRVMRLFLLPGVGHCGGGDGFAQFDTLSGLMAWVEGGAAPTMMVAERIPDRRGPGGPPANGADGRTAMAGRSGAAPSGPTQGSPPPNGPMGMSRPATPYAQADQPPLGARPIYAFPNIPRYRDSGDVLAAASYAPITSPAGDPPINWYGSYLLTPGFQRDYEVVDGRLVTGR